jgi:hypothetical protein
MKKLKEMIAHCKNSISISSLYHREYIVGFIAGAVLVTILAIIF